MRILKKVTRTAASKSCFVSLSVSMPIIPDKSMTDAEKQVVLHTMKRFKGDEAIQTLSLQLMIHLLDAGKLYSILANLESHLPGRNSENPN